MELQVINAAAIGGVWWQVRSKLLPKNDKKDCSLQPVTRRCLTQLGQQVQHRYLWMQVFL